MSPSTARSPATGPAEICLTAPQLRKILVVMNPTAVAHPALEKAVQIAKRCQSELELYVCDAQKSGSDNTGTGARIAESDEAALERMKDGLDRLAAPIRDQGLVVHTVCERHAPMAQGIGYHIIRTLPDLVVKDTHHHALLRSVISHTDWLLIQQVPVALLLVRPTPWSSSPRIAAAVDPLHPADRPITLDGRIAGTGRCLSDVLQGSLELIHVLQAPPHLPGDRVTPEQKQMAHARARAAVQQLARPVHAAAHFAEGSLCEGIISLASDLGPDVLVMGTAARPRSAITGVGGTAARVLEGADCDLLVLKPPEFVSPLLVTAD